MLRSFCPTFSSIRRGASVSKHALRCFSEVKVSSELDDRQRKALEERKVRLYEMAQKDYLSRDVPTIKAMVQSIIDDYPPCMHALNIILKTNILLNDGDGMRETLERITRAGLKPNLITYNLLISYYRNLGRMEDAMAVFERMKAAGQSPNASVYTTLIAGWANLGNFSLAEELFTESQKKAYIRPDLHLYNTMISCYLSAGRPEEARRLAQMMTEHGLAPNHVTYKVFISELLENQQMTEAERIYDDHVKDAPGMRAHDYGDVAFRFFRAGHSSKGLEIYEATMERFGSCSPIATSCAVTAYSSARPYTGKEEAKIKEIEQAAMQSKTLLSACCHALLRHRLKLFSECHDAIAAERVRAIYEKAVSLDIRISPRIEALCREAMSN